MKLFLISQSVNNGYDTYGSAVVAAENEHDAARIYPTNDPYYCDNCFDEEQGAWYYIDRYKDHNFGKRIYQRRSSDWVVSPKQVHVKYLGEADEGTQAGCILASFNAG